MTLTDLSESQQQAIHDLAREHVGTAFAAEFVGGGRNSRIYRLAGNGGPVYALKVYFRHPSDPRDRLGTEFNALSFLWKNGIDNIPRPIASWPQAGIALYEFIEGGKLAAGSLTELDVDAAVDFAIRLKALTARPEAMGLNAASEAYFSIDHIFENIQRRLKRFATDERDQETDPALTEFLQLEFLPTLDRVSSWSRAESDWQQEIALGERTLSPSDFGFHNAIRRDRIVFLDFEYFGWDDPAKLISDFILHPAMNLDASLAQRFARGLVRHFDERLVARVKSVYPLFGLKWCLICLNEFLPEHRARRQFAAITAQDWACVRAEQLAKASRVLSRIIEEYEHFPYFD